MGNAITGTKSSRSADDTRNVMSPAVVVELQKRGFTLLGKIGEGAYSKVYMVEYASKNCKMKLACKVINVEDLPQDFLGRFLPRELEILPRVRHPSLLQLQSIYHLDNTYYIFMQYADNGDLLHYITKKGAIIEAQALFWFRQLVLGVQYLHHRHIVHRDIKCENILITKAFNVKLSDFGFARSMLDNKGKRVLSTTYCGSVSYVAPEVLKGMPYDPEAADVWSLGVVLFTMLNKSLPFKRTNVLHVLHQQVNREWRFREKVKINLSKQVQKLVKNLLEPDVESRIGLIDMIRPASLVGAHTSVDEMVSNQAIV